MTHHHFHFHLIVQQVVYAAPPFVQARGCADERLSRSLMYKFKELPALFLLSPGGQGAHFE